MMMDLSTFLGKVILDHALPNQSVICLHGLDQSPVLFFSALRVYLRVLGIEKLDLSGAGFEQYAPQLYTTFLGNRQIYWLGDSALLAENDHTRVLRLVSTYTGPHTLILFSGQTCATAQNYGVALPEHIDKTLYMQLATLYQLPREQVDKIIAYDNQKMLRKNLDETCLFLQYISVMGRVEHHDLHELIRLYGQAETSLFKLSQAFFEKKEPTFFRLWATLYTRYTPQFWIAFWSEQVWRAITYTVLMRAHNVTDAKSIGYRLPFALLQHGWKSINTDELKKAHTLLCDLEYDFKNGGNEHYLDLLYLKYFIGAF